jgi:cyclohexyl-isocyanide hydratase
MSGTVAAMLQVACVLFPNFTQLDLTEPFGAWPKRERVVVSGNRITGGGVTAGIDIALTIAEKVHSKAVAEGIQLAIEYAPQPPFNAGSPDTAPPEIRDAVAQKLAPMKALRARAVMKAASKLGS